METNRIYLATEKENRDYQRWKTNFVSDFRIHLRRKYFVSKIRSKITFSYEIFFSFLISLLILRIPVVKLRRNQEQAQALSIHISALSEDCISSMICVYLSNSIT